MSYRYKYPPTPVDVSEVAGTRQTGRDWSSDFARLQNIDISLSALRDSLKPTRSPATQDLSNYSLAGSGSVSVDKTGLEGWSALVAVVQATYNASATAGVRVVWLYSPDGVNYDSLDDAVALNNYHDLSFAAGATRQATILIPVLTPYVRVVVVNKDPTYASTISVWTLALR